MYVESSQANETDCVDNNTTQTSNHESLIVMARGPQAILRSENTMGWSPEASREPIRAVACSIVRQTEQNPWGSADSWTVPDEGVFRVSISARLFDVWKHGSKPRSCDALDVQREENAAWWALMHISEEWAKKSQRKRNRADDTPGPTPKNPTTSGQPGPSGHSDPLTRDTSIHTPMLDPSPAANPTHGVSPPTIASPPVGPLPVGPVPVGPLPVGPVPVGPLSVVDPLGGLFGGRLQGFDVDN